jgi:methionine-rich copper-binding protein CopC
MALSPARFELEMKPGTETTVVVNLDYRAAENAAQPARIVASLNDWSITREGRVEYYRANSRSDSASSWLIYSPGEAAVAPGTIHQIRVTISVPMDATPGDHLTSLIVEQRPEQLKYEQSTRQMIVRYRMASVFYIKVPGLTKKGSVEELYAEATPDTIEIRPTLKNEGNSMVRPTASVKVVDADGKTVADIPELEPLPVLAGSETDQAVRIDKALPPGNYTVKFRIDFQDGAKATEAVTDLVVKAPQIANSAKPIPKP